MNHDRAIRQETMTGGFADTIQCRHECKAFSPPQFVAFKLRENHWIHTLEPIGFRLGKPSNLDHGDPSDSDASV